MVTVYAGGGKSKGQSKKPDAEVARSAEPTASLDWLAKVADEIAEAAPDDGVERWDLRSELGTQMAQAVHKGSVARWCEVWWHTNKLAAMLDTANSSISGARQRTTIIIGGVIAQEEALRMNALLTVRRILQVTQPTMPLDSLRQVVLDIPLPSENAVAESTPQGGSGLWGNMQKAVQGIKKAVDGKASALLSQPVLDAIKRLRSGDVDWDQDYVLVDDQKFLVHISKLPKETVRLVLRAAMDGMFTLQRKKVGESQAMPAWDTAEETEMLLRYLLQGNPEYDRHFVNAAATGTTMGDAQARLDAALYDLATYKLPEDPKQQKGGKSGSKKRSGGKKGGGSKAAASSKGFGKKK